MKTGREVIQVAKQSGTEALAFHIAVEEMALQRDMTLRALVRLLAAVDSGAPVPGAVLADARSALEFCSRH